MSDETISADTTTSPSEAAPVVETAVVEPVADTVETSVLGGDDTPAAEETITPEAAAAEAPTGAPEAYELSLEGMTLDTDLMSEAEPIFRDLNLTNDQANALLPLAPKIMEKARDATMQQLIEAGAMQRKGWLDDFIADKAIGGVNREETEHLAAKGMEAVGFGKDHPFRKVLTDTGFGNNPDMIRTFRLLGEMVAEDGSFVRANTGEAKADLPYHERAFPNG